MNKYLSQILSFRRDDLYVVLLIVLITVLSYVFLSSANNTTGMLGGDGWGHSIYAENIIETGKISYTDPYRLFEGEHIHGEVAQYPIHYTQLFHVSLGLFNEFLGVGVFSYGFSLSIAILLTCVFRIFFRAYFKPYECFILISLLFLCLGSRLFYINFMEGYLFLFLFFSLFLLFRYHVTKKNLFLYSGVLFLAYFSGIKHIGLFDGALLVALLSFYLLFLGRFKQLFFSLLVYFSFLVSFYFPIWNSLGTIGYGVGTLSIPDQIPFSENITLLFDSKYQMPEDRVWEKLSYQQEKSISQYVGAISNFLREFGSFQRPEQLTINYVFLFLVALGFIVFFRKKKKEFAIIWLFVMGREFLLLIGLKQNLNQYIHLIVIGSVIFAFQGVVYILGRLPRKFSVLLLSVLLVSLFGGYFEGAGERIYADVGRRYESNELLYRSLGEYIVTQPGIYSGAVFLASDPQFSFYAKEKYIWEPTLWRDQTSDVEEIIKNLKEYYGVDYVVVNDMNFTQNGAYDYIPEGRFNYLRREGFIELVEVFEIGPHNLSLYKI